ncbi:MAG: polysaccharide deacetylase family protein [Candidatus Cloacimonadaceae bacterium]
MKRYFLATNDVESTSIKYNKQRDITAAKVLSEGIPKLLELYKSLDVKSTFFFTGEITSKYPEIVRMVLPDGHEVACHGYSHEDEFAFDRLSYHEQVKQLTKAKALLEDISGTEVISFRAPALRVNEFTPKALEDTGFEIDSSISSQRADGILSFGALRKLNRLIAPRIPYFTGRHCLAQKGNSQIYEIPISAMVFPYIGTFMRIYPILTKMLREFLHLESSGTGKPVNFLIHPNECILEDDEDTVARRSDNPVKYLLAEKFRTYLKQKNLGEKTLQLYKEQLEYFQAKGYSFCTLAQYKKENVG